MLKKLLYSCLVAAVLTVPISLFLNEDTGTGSVEPSEQATLLALNEDTGTG